MKNLGKDDLAMLLPYSELIEALRIGFKEGGNVPLRHFHNVKTDDISDNSLLLMPCWQQGGMMGVKLTMVCPDNHKKGIESVQSTYLLSDATTGVTKAILNGDELTVRRTSCASALASSYLSDPNARSMLMMGAGKLAPHLIRAHATARPLKDIYIWARRYEQAKKLADKLNHQLPINVSVVSSPEKYANICDIISCATLSKEPILKQKWLSNSKNQHIDLVGGYTYDMREADNEIMASSSIYVDTIDGALNEAGDILRPIAEGAIVRGDIKGDLYNMVAKGFQNPESRTVFKSVGTALEDLIAAKLAFEKTAL